MSTNVSDVGEVVNTTLDGRSVEKLLTCAVCEAGDITITLTAAHLKFISAIYDVEVKSTSPPSKTGTIAQKKISANTIAITLYDVAVSATICLESCLLGW